MAQLTEEQQEALKQQKEQCPFCKIIKGDIPSKKVYEDDTVVAVLDINPAAQGHTLVMPKEHYPIMPLIPEKEFNHLAVTTRNLSKAIKETIIVANTTIFIANGAAAGQQSNHFMLHIIPREKEDGLSNFDLPVNQFEKEKIAEVHKVLSNNIPIMVRRRTSKFAPAGAPKTVAYTKEELLKIIEQNTQLKKIILEQPEEFKKQIPTNPQLKALFANIDINEIIEAVSGKKIVDAEITGETDEGKEEKTVEETGIPVGEKPTEAKEGMEEATFNDVVNLVNENPKVKDMILNDFENFKLKVQTVPQLNEVFGKVNLDKLREELIKKEKKEEPKEDEILRELSGGDDGVPDEESNKENERGAEEKEDKKDDDSTDFDTISGMFK